MSAHIRAGAEFAGTTWHGSSPEETYAAQKAALLRSFLCSLSLRRSFQKLQCFRQLLQYDPEFVSAFDNAAMM